MLRSFARFRGLIYWILLLLAAPQAPAGEEAYEVSSIPILNQELAGFDQEAWFTGTVSGAQSLLHSGGNTLNTVPATSGGANIAGAPNYLTVGGTRLFFTADPEGSNREVWAFTPSSEALYNFESNVTGAGNPSELTWTDGTLFYQATHTAGGTRLFHTNGGEGSPLSFKETSSP